MRPFGSFDLAIIRTSLCEDTSPVDAAQSLECEGQSHWIEVPEFKQFEDGARGESEAG